VVKFPFSRRSEPVAARDENGDGRIDEHDRTTAAGDGRAVGTPVTGAPATTTAPAATTTASTGTAVAEPTVTDRDGEQTTYRSSTATLDRPAPADERPHGTSEAERKAAERGALARAATSRPATATRPAVGTTGVTGTPAAVNGADRTGPTGAARTDTRENPVVGAPEQGRHSPDLEPPVDADRRSADGSLVAGRRSDDDSEVTDRRLVDDARDGHPADQPEPAAVAAGPRPRASLLATLGLIVGVCSALFVLTGTLAGYAIGLGVVAVLLCVFGMAATRRRHIAGKSDALIGLLLGIGAVVVGILAMTGRFDWPTTDGDQVLRLREWLDSQFVDRF
jgi:hypothetical protein